MKSTRLKPVGILIISLCFALWGISTAQATVVLKLFDGFTTTTLADGGAGDLCPDVGCVTFLGAVGAFNVNVSTAISKPLVGGPDSAVLDLNSIDVSSSATGGTLTIWATDTNFTLSPGQRTLISAIGGTTDGTVTAQQWLDMNNGQFSETGFLITPGPQGLFGPGAFSDTATTTFDYPGGPFSITEKVVIAHTAGRYQVTSLDINSVVPVPEPATALLLGAGLLSAAAWSRRRRR